MRRGHFNVIHDLTLQQKRFTHSAFLRCGIVRLTGRYARNVIEKQNSRASHSSIQQIAGRELLLLDTRVQKMQAVETVT
jgi:hypothetical protein